MTATTPPPARWHRATVLLAAAVVAAACGAMPEHADPRPVVGCHFFDQDVVARDLQLPWGVRLLDRPLEGWPALQQRPGVMQATTLTGHDEVDFPFGYWVVSAEDSLEIGYPAGGGLLLELAMINGALEGRARPVGDAVPAPGVGAGQRAHPVRLTWARCPEEP